MFEISVAVHNSAKARWANGAKGPPAKAVFLVEVIGKFLAMRCGMSVRVFEQ
jgi:post-segregation antitoxin (ccd killing protein)